MRDNQTQYSSPEAMADVASWIEDCSENHAKCAGREGDPSSMPIRVLRISEHGESAYLSSFGNPKERYGALSYTWGSISGFSTTKSTLDSRSRPFPVATLPQTIHDAVIVAKRIGLECIWVDSLCIVQDSEEDKANEIAKMDAIYQNAFVTIAATNALSANSGFLGHTYCDTISHRLPMTYPDGSTGHVFVRDRSWTSAEPLDDRAWALQERYLSPRLLDYTSIGMTKKCRDRYVEEGERPLNPHNMDRFRKELALIINPDLPSGRAYESDMVLGVWDHIVQLYTGRAMTDPNDKLLALGGLAARFQRHLSYSKYFAGLWYRFLPAGLCWNGYAGYRRRKPGSSQANIRRSPVYRAPSWSWASTDGPINSSSKMSDFLPFTLEVISCQVTLANTLLPFGKVIGGTLVVEGYARETVCRPSPIRDQEMQVGRVRLDVMPDDFGEWFEALKGTRILLLEIQREVENEGSSDETESEEGTRSKGLGLKKAGLGILKRLSKRAELTHSEGLMLRKIGKEESYSRLGYFREIDETRKGWLFEGCAKRRVEIV